MSQRGFAVAAFRDLEQWRCAPLPPSVLGDLDVLLAALRSQSPEGGPFVLAGVEDEFFLIARLRGTRTLLLLSDLTASVEFPLAAQALDQLGEEPPDDDEMDDAWPIGDLELFEDLGLSEDEMDRLFDDPDAYPDETLEAIVNAIGLAEPYRQAVESLRP
ncbi:MAG: tRNA adenosine deaminase-associated protein [Actinomycetia bacterium]|nr:tRNA adenosine deaminase-associated protein [Actinomycetes bacterium]